MLKWYVPLGVFVILAVFLAVGLTLKPREIPTPFIGRQAPEFKLSQLHDFQKTFSPADMKGKVWMLNVWASWCVACRAEHPILLEMARRGDLNIYGLNYKDQPNEAKTWLVQQGGNPYAVNAVDFDGRVGIDYGVYGVPETFVIDQQGIIRHKVIGPITREELNTKLLPLIKQLEQQG